MGVVENDKNFKKISKSTRINIQAHPGLPPMSFMFSIAAESNPEKAPDNWMNLRWKKIDSTLYNAPQPSKKIGRF